MVQVRVHHAEQLERIFSQSKKEANIVLWRAINRAAIAARTRASVEIRKKYVIKAADVKRRIKIKSANATQLVAEIRASGPVTPLMQFDVSPKFPDIMKVRARVLRENSMEVIQTGFVTRVRKNGFVNVFTRVGTSRYPIRGLYGPSVAQMMGKDEIIESIQARAQEMLDNRLEHEIKRFLYGGV